MKKVGLLLSLCLLTTALFGQEPRLVLPIFHTDDITDASFSPDSKRIVTASNDNTAKIWDAQTGMLLATLRGHTEYVLSVNYSANGKMIVTTSSDNSAKLWNARTGALLFNLKGHSDKVDNAIFSPDGHKVVTGCRDKTMRIWNTYTGALVAIIKSFCPVAASSFSPDNKRIVTASYNNTVKIWDLQTGKALGSLKGHTDFIKSAAFSPDGKKIITASEDNTVKVWNAQTCGLLLNLKGNFGKLSSACFFPDGNKIATSSRDRIARIWDVKTGRLLISIKGYRDYFDNLSFSPDGERIVGVSSDRSIKIWDTENGEILSDFKTNEDVENAIVSFSPDGKKILSVLFSKFIMVLNAQSGELIDDLKGHTSRVGRITFCPDGKRFLLESEYRCSVWNAQTDALIIYKNAAGSESNDVSFSPDGKKVVTPFSDSTAKVWDAQIGALLVNFKGHTENVHNASFSPDGRKVITASSDGTAKLWDAQTGMLLFNLKGSNDVDGYTLPITLSMDGASFSPDGRKIITWQSSGTKLWDVETGKLQADFKQADHGAAFSPDSKKVITYSNPAQIWDVETGSLIGKLAIGSSIVNSPDGKSILTTNSQELGQLWDAQTQKLINNISGWNDADITAASFSPDGLKIVTGSDENGVKIWNAKTGNLQFNLNGHTGSVTTAIFSPDGKMILTASEDNTIKRWNPATGKLLNTFFLVDSGDYFSQIPSGYYMATQNAAKLLHYVTKNLDVITFDQLDIKYNRPDKVLEAIGCPDTALIHAYHRAYEKRIRKLGIDTTSFKSGYSVPKSDFLNRDRVEQQPEQKQDQLSLHIKGSDSTYNLDRFNVWVNQVPVYGIRGISLKRKIRHNLDTTVTITLSQGRNRIETSITDINGTESYHMPLFVKYTPDKSVDTLIHFVGIGINKFKDKNYNLSWSVKDIHDLALKFKDKYKDKCTIDTLFDENVTAANVIALKKSLLKSGVNDKVIIAYSGHGLLSKDYDYFLSTYNVDFDDPAKNGLPYDALENLLDSIPARKKLMLIDACHSGELDKDEMNRYTQTTADRQKNGVTDPSHSKGTHIDLVQKSGMSMASSFELMKQLFVNVGKSTGATVISAAGGVQYALEKNDLKNGVFTYSILENMQQNPHVNLSTLKQYVNKRVTELTAGMQVPTTRNETDVVDWQVW